MDKNTKPLNVRLKPNEQKSSIKKTTRKASLTRKTTKDNKNRKVVNFFITKYIQIKFTTFCIEIFQWNTNKFLTKSSSN